MLNAESGHPPQRSAFILPRSGLLALAAHLRGLIARLRAGDGNDAPGNAG